ncbi:AT-hook motif nuclear-localized protein 29-like [Silene latifolia]|uniref:AT-hook motif nuclear-localized protein 29-like n=1 Tax=Silene latifolia TaxID=37657 RepID=UPI003D778118
MILGQMSGYERTHLMHLQQQSAAATAAAESQTTSSSQELETQNPAQTSSGSGPTRRPRGRPAGSKNKPRPPIVVTRDTPNVLRSHMLEIASNTDIMESLAKYAHQRGRGISIVSGTGSVQDVTIKNPADTNTVVTLRGRFEILSLTGTILPPPAPPQAGGLSVFLSGGSGQVVGGAVVGPLMTSGPVLLMAASFSNAIFERLPLEQEEQEDHQVHSSGGGGGGGSGYDYPFPGSGAEAGDHSHLGWSGNVSCPPF